jgi:4-phytase/acid phosphatase
VRSSNAFQLSTALLAFALASITTSAQAQEPQVSVPSNTEDLRFVVVVSRHGVRSPTGKLDQLNQYSTQPWPTWSVAPGYLTEHGAKLMTLFGAYDRELWTQQRLLSGTGCEDADRIAILADSDQRTRETGKALAEGIMPGCSLETHALPEGTPDPLFHPLEAGVHADKELARAAVAGRIANNPGSLVSAYRLQLEALEDVLATPKSGVEAVSNPAATPSPARKSLFDIPSSLAVGKGDHLVDLRSPLGTAATLSENLLLEYTEGMPEVGWGKVNAQKLRDLMQIHTDNSDIERRTSYVARAQASNMLSHILDSMQQAVEQQPVVGALNATRAKVLILVGHDTNLTNISGTLNLSWITDGRRDDTPPGGAIVFELWQKQSSKQYLVRMYYTAQSLDQMRNSVVLSPANPPDRALLFLPGCGNVDGSCSWSDFLKTVHSAISAAPVL